MTALDTIKNAVLGQPVNPAHNPSRQGVVRAFAEMQMQVEAAQAGAFIRSTLAALNAFTAAPASAMAWVTGDTVAAANGIYENIGPTNAAVWVRRSSIPQFVVTAMNTGEGTADAIRATTDLFLPIEDGRTLIMLPILETNITSNPHVSLNGGTVQPILSNSGNSVQIGGLVAGMIVCGYQSLGNFRLISDPANASLVAAAEAAAEAADLAAQAAIGAVPNVFTPTITTMKALPTATVNACFLTQAKREGTFIFRSGDYAARIAADPYNFLYVKADDKAATVGAWVRAGDIPAVGINAAWGGIDLTGVTVETAKFQSLLNLVSSEGSYAYWRGTILTGTVNTIGQIVIKGLSKHHTYLKSNVGNASILVHEVSSPIELENMTFTGFIGASSGYSVKIEGASFGTYRPRVHNVAFTDGYNQLGLIAAFEGDFKDITFNTPGNVALSISNTRSKLLGRHNFTNLRFYGRQGEAPNGISIYHTSGSDLNFTNIYSYNVNVDYFLAAASDTHLMGNVQFNGIHLQGSGTNFYFRKAGAVDGSLVANYVINGGFCYGRNCVVTDNTQTQFMADIIVSNLEMFPAYGGSGAAIDLKANPVTLSNLIIDGGNPSSHLPLPGSGGITVESGSFFWRVNNITFTALEYTVVNNIPNEPTIIFSNCKGMYTHSMNSITAGTSGEYLAGACKETFIFLAPEDATYGITLVDTAGSYTIAAGVSSGLGQPVILTLNEHQKITYTCSETPFIYANRLQ